MSILNSLERRINGIKGIIEMKNLDNLDKLLTDCVVLSFHVMIVGLFLYVNFVPLQDISTYTREELIEAHKQLAINYHLGRVFFIPADLRFVSV